MVSQDAEGNTFADPTGIIQTKRCPYWSRNPDKHQQESGYCAYAEYGDWQHGGFGLLWDQVKECGVNLCEEDEDYIHGIPIELVETV